MIDSCDNPGCLLCNDPDPIQEFPSEETDGPPLGSEFVPADAFNELAYDHEQLVSRFEDAQIQVEALEENNAELEEELQWLYDRYDTLWNLIVLADKRLN